MSGKIIVKQRLGISKDPNFDFYPEWYFEIQGENGIIINISPSYDDLTEIISNILTHEFLVDETRKRNPDFTRWKNWLSNLPEVAKQSAQTKFKFFIEKGIPEIYLKPKKV